MDVDGRSRRALQTAAAVALACGVGAFVYIVLNSVPCYFDDAYMFIRYANNLLAGYGHAWNPGGEQTFGSTSLTHLGVVTLLRACFGGLSNARLLLVASAIPAAALLAVLVVACAGLTRHRLLSGNYVLWGGLLVPALVLQEPFKYHLRSGMDTMLSTLCNALLIFVTMRLVVRPGTRRLIAVVAIAYLTYLTRPDNGIYSTLFPALCILLLVSGPRRKLLATFSVSMIAVLVVDLLVKRALLGTALPLPFYAKQHGAYEGYLGVPIWNPIVFMRTFFAVALPFVCIILFFIQRRELRMLSAFLVPVALTFAYYFSVNQIMGFEARFYYPALPFFVVGAALLVDGWFLNAPEDGTVGQGEFLLRLIVMLFVVLAGRQATYSTYLIYDRLFEEPSAGPPSRRYEITAATPLPDPGWEDTAQQMAMIAQRAPKGTKIALSEYGLVGAAAPQVTMIDVVGLHDKYFALNGFSAEELFRREPDLIWFPHSHYTRMVRDILDSDEFWDRYLYYPGAFALGLAIRKDSEHFDELMALIKERWKVGYGDRKMEDYLARPVD